jgi:MSHA pilin protein MshC
MQRGFTIIELIAVMILIGIVGAVAASRFFDRKTFDAANFADQTRTMLRYAQKVAIAQNREVYVRLDSSSVALCFNAVCGAAYRVKASAGSNSGSAATVASCSADSSWACEAMPTGISYTVAPNTVTMFYYDKLGRPCAQSDVPPAVVSNFVQTTVSVSGDGGTHDIIVEPETGYVH